MADLEIRGDIVSDDMAWIYDFFEMSCICPQMVRDAIADLSESEDLTVHINSYGGDVQAGQEIYTALSGIRSRVNVQVESVACSAASVIAMAGGHVSMSPVALLMIHRAWSTTQGNTNDMAHDAEMLATVDSALASAYAIRTGIAKAEILEMMDKETWLTAADALEKGFIDEVIDYNAQAPMQAAAAFGGLSITPEMIARAEAARAKEQEDAKAKAAILDDLDEYGI